MDTRIPLAVRTPDIVGSIGKGIQLKGLQTQQSMQDMQLRQAEDEAQAQRTLADLYRGNVGADGQVNRAGVLQGAADRGLGARIPTLQKQFAEADKLGAEVKNTNSQIDERQLGMAKKKLEATGAGLQSLLANPNATPDDALNMIQGLVNAQIVTPEEGAKAWREIPTGSPQQFRSYLMQKGLQIVEANKRIELLTPRVQNINLGGSEQFVDTNTFTNPGVVGQQLTRTQTPDSVASNETTRRGQNMADARARETAASAQFIPVDGVGLFVGDKKTGTARPVTDQDGNAIKPNKPLTEGQAKAVAFASRMQASDRIINELADAGTSVSVPGSRAGFGVGATINAVSPEANQRLDQAKRDFINAVLRRESGAVISDAEFANAERQYFPQIGEGEGVKRQKAENRRVALEGMKADVPEGRLQQVDQIAAPKNGALVPIKSDADYNKLPSGTRFQAPDGSIRVKP